MKDADGLNLYLMVLVALMVLLALIGDLAALMAVTASATVGVRPCS